MTGTQAPPAPGRPRGWHAAAARLNPVRALRLGFQRWWLARLVRSDTLLLTQRNVYILPTGAGAMLALTLAALLVASINYQLNLGYLLSFLLAGSALAGMQVCHGNLRGISLHMRAPQAHFLGSSAALQVQLTSTRRSARHAIALAVHGQAPAHWAWCDLPAQGQATVQLAFCPARRGLHPLPTLLVQTLFPLGSFRVWSYWRPAAQLLVYPAPELPAPPLPAGECADASRCACAPGAGEFDGVRAYRRGDAPKLIVWKKAAKALAAGSDALISRDTQQAQQQQLWLDLARTALSDPEARIARLTAWVLQADRLGLTWGLRLPGQQIGPDSGAAHRRRCLEALALY